MKCIITWLESMLILSMYNFAEDCKLVAPGLGTKFPEAEMFWLLKD